MTTRSMLVPLLAVLAGTTATLACDPDAKIRDRRPPVIGPIMTAADGGGDVGQRGGFTSHNVTLQAWMPLNNFQGSPGSGADCWGYTSPSGREYALVGLRNGLHVVEVTNPATPVIVGFISGTNSLWHDVTVVGNYAYTCSDQSGPGIQVVDLSNVDNGVVTKVATVTPSGMTTIHTLLSNPASGRLYACGSNISNGGCVCLDVSNNPLNPTITGAWTTQYVHECEVVTHTSGPYAGQEIAYLFSAGPYYGYTNGFAIARVNANGTLTNLKLTNYPGIQFCHQGSVTPDYQYVYINDELDEGNTVSITTGRILNVSDINNPTFVKTFTNNETSIDHNEYVKDGKLYCSNYTTGLRVFDISDTLNPEEVAWFDTYPESDGASFNGNWGNFVFDSGTVIMSDLERGLFVVTVTFGNIDFTFPSGIPDALAPGIATPITADVVGEDEAVLDPATVRLNVSIDGGAYETIALADDAGDSFTGAFPPVDCGQSVDFYFSAGSLDGRTFTSPAGAPSISYSAIVATEITQAFADNFETDKGWTVSNSNLTDGAWQRGIPAGGGDRGDPATDADGSGRCYLTANEAGDSDVDGGPTRLISPTIDLSAAADATISYWHWFSNDDGDGDRLAVEVSNNNGASWVSVASHANSGGWQQASFSVADYVPPSAQVKVRFSASDNPNDSVTEAAVDGFEVSIIECVPPCPADFDGNGQLNVFDFLAYQTAFSEGDPKADVAPPFGTLNVFDFLAYQTMFSDGC